MRATIAALSQLSVTLLAWITVAATSESPYLPGPWRSLLLAREVLSDRSVVAQFLQSLLLVTGSAAVASAAALVVALVWVRAAHRSRLARWIHEVVRYMPVPALFPLALGLTGGGIATASSLVIVGTYFQLVFLYQENLSAVPADLIHSARLLGRSGAHAETVTRLRVALPAVSASTRVAYAWAWSYLLVAESTGAERGIGVQILAWYRFDGERVLPAVILLGLFGLLVDRTWVRCDRALFSWSKP